MSSNPQSSEKQTKAGTATKRAQADANEADSKVLKKAKPSICKAAEELVCPILQGLPIDPVTAEDVSQGVCLCCCACPLQSAHIYLHVNVRRTAFFLLLYVISGSDLRAGGNREISEEGGACSYLTYHQETIQEQGIVPICSRPQYHRAFDRERDH